VTEELGNKNLQTFLISLICTERSANLVLLVQIRLSNEIRLKVRANLIFVSYKSLREDLK